MEKSCIDLEKLRYFYETQDLTNKQIAKELNCSESHVVDVVRRYKMNKYDKYSHITREVLEDLYINQKLSMSQVAEKLGTYKSVIQRRIEKFNLRLGYNPCLVETNDSEIIRLYTEERVSAADVGKKLGIGESVVRKRLEKKGIKIRRSKKDLALTDEEIISLYEQGVSLSEIGKKCGCHKENIRYKLKRLGVYEREKEIPISQEGEIETIFDLPQEEVRKFLSEGKTYEEIAGILGTSQGIVSRGVRELGLRESSKIDKATYEELFTLYIIQGKSQKEISKIYNCCTAKVLEALRRVGIDKRDEKERFSKEFLENLYLKQGKSILEISKTVGVGKERIRKQIHDYNIEKEFKFSYISMDELKKFYVDELLTINEIAEKTGWPKKAIIWIVYSYHLNDLRDPKEHELAVKRAHRDANKDKRSAAEDELLGMYPTNYTNDLTAIGWELDLWYPEKNFAIEYNGDYWHSTSSKAGASKHIAKTTICENTGIYLMNIFERFWKNKKEKVKIINILDNVLNPEKLKDVQGIPEEVSLEEVRKFENEYNINKSSKKATFAVAIKEGNKLLSSLSYNMIDNEIHIERFTTRVGYKEDYKILVYYLIKHYNPKFITVNCDRRYYDGSIWKKLYFKCTDKTKASYVYVKGFREVSESEYNKDSSSTFKVYDCGYSKWQWMNPVI